METTPNDLRQQQFEIKFRGYNPDDVEVFRELAANALEEARAEVLKLTEENSHLGERLKHLINLEETLKAAVLEAQKNSESTIATAKKEASVTLAAAEKEKELIIREAQNVRDEVIADMHRRMGKLVNDINKIRFIRNNYLSQLKHLLASQTEMVDRAMAEETNEEKPIMEMPKRPVYDPPKTAAPPPRPEYEKPEPATKTPPPAPAPESSEVPDMHIQQPPTEPAKSVQPDIPEETHESDSHREAAAPPPEPPPAQPEADDEWQRLKEQLSEDN
jgi:DivIVA domain-containing protein